MGGELATKRQKEGILENDGTVLDCDSYMNICQNS